MKTDWYVILNSEEKARELIEQIDGRMGEHWADPILNPLDRRAAIPWNREYLEDHADLISGYTTASTDAAMKAGFEIGFHKGIFAQAERKIEEARFTASLIPQGMSVPNFPACRALFYGFQSSIYSAREAMKKSCRKLGGTHAIWWREVEKRLKRHEPFIHFLHVDYNRDKHGEASGILKPILSLGENAGPRPDCISGEGIFSVEDTHQGMLKRRHFHEGLDFAFRVDIDFEPQTVSGENVTRLPLHDKLLRISTFFEGLIVEGKQA